MFFLSAEQKSPASNDALESRSFTSTPSKETLFQLLTQQLNSVDNEKRLTSEDKLDICNAITDFLLAHGKSQEAIVLENFPDGYSPWAINFKLTIGNCKFVLRYIHNTTAGNTNKAKLEIALMQLTAEAKVHPKVHVTGKKLVIRDYIKEDCIWRNTITAEKLKLLAQFLKNAHEIKVSYQLNKYIGYTCPLFDKIVSDTHIKIQKSPSLNYFKSVINAIQELEDMTNLLVTKKTFCHCDLHPGNYLFNGENFYLIDLENARLGDGLFDVATISLFLKLSAEQEKIILTAYLRKNPSAIEMQRWTVAKALSSLYFCLGMLHTMSSEVCSQIDVSSLSESTGNWYDYKGTTTPSELTAEQRMSVVLMQAKNGLKILEMLKGNESTPSCRIRALL